MKHKTRTKALSLLLSLALVLSLMPGMSMTAFADSPIVYYLDANGELWITREQIGKFLGYKNPADAMARIHTKHSDRLGNFSKRINTPNSETRKVIAYSFKGLLEICRWSRQPNADAILDCLWELIEEIEINSQEERR